MYYYLGPERETLGPVSFEALQELVADGTVGPDDVVWAEGWEDWQPARTVSDLFPDLPEEVALGIGGEAGFAGDAAPGGVGVGTPPVHPGVMTAQSTSPWAIPAMPPAGYTPTVFKSLYVWYLVTTVLVFVLILLTGVVIAIGFSMGRRDGEAVVMIGAIAMVLVSLGAIVPAILFYVLLYKMWRQIQDGFAQTGPGKAVGFMFIPCFQYYWIFIAFWGLAGDLNKYADRHSIAIRRVSPGLAMAVCITLIATIIPYLGILIALALVPMWLAMAHQMARASKDIAAALEQRSGSGATGPAFA